MIESEEYQQGYRDGFAAALKGKPKPIPTHCPVCKLAYKDMTLYVCSNQNCPTQIRATI